MADMGEIAVRLLLGAVIGGIIGFERHSHGRPAGFRTHLIVCVASVLLMVISEKYAAMAVGDSEYLRIDPGRVAAGAITGIGFLGAGVIVKSGFTVLGLTTAACIWMVAAIGLSIGGGMYGPALIATGITVVTLWALRRVERNMEKVIYKYISIASDSADRDREIEAIIKEARASVTNINFEYDRAGTYNFLITISMSDATDLRTLFQRLTAVEGINRVSIKG